MKNNIINTLLILISFFVLTACVNTVKKEVISKEALLKTNSGMLFSTFVNNAPGNETFAEVNPPRFRWYYLVNPLDLEQGESIKPSLFRFQVADNKKFENPLINIVTEFNFYNELAPFPEGKNYYWRVGYILDGDTEPSAWSDTFSVNIPTGIPKWDRSVLQNLNLEGHPRLLFNKSNISELRKLASENPVFTKDILNTAKEMCKHKWWNNWPKDDTKVPEFTKSKTEDNQFMWHISRKLMQTAFAYLVTNDNKYSNILEIWTTIAAYPKGGPASPEGMGGGYALSEDNTSITEFIALVYDWFYDKLNPRQKRIFEESLEWRISSWMYDFKWGGSIYKGGIENPRLSHSSIAIAGFGHSWEGALDTYPASIVLYEKSETARKYFHWLTNYLIAVGERVAQNDGYDLGAHYGQSHMKWLVYQLMYLKSAIPELQIEKNPLYKRYAEFFTAMVPIGMQYSHFGRLSQHGAGMSQRTEIFGLLAYLLGDGEVLENWLNTSSIVIKNEYDMEIGLNNYNWRQWVHVAAPLQFKGRLSPKTSNKSKYVFPIIGYVMAHSGNPSKPQTFKNGVGVIYCCKSSRGDRYNNENTFQMYAYGQHLNFGGHSGDENAFGYQTISANTIMVDGIGQTVTEQSRTLGYRGNLIAYKEGEYYTYWMGEAVNAYPKQTEIVSDQGNWTANTQLDYDDSIWGDKGAPQLERFRRHMLFMRDKYLVIYDDLKTKSDRPSLFSWRYRILQDCELNYNPSEGLINYSLDSVNIFIKHVASPEFLDYMNLKDLDQYKNPITGFDYMKDNPWTARDMKIERYRKMVAQHNLWITTKNPKTEHNFFVVIYPVKPGTEKPIITRLDNNTVKIEKDKEVDIISFDKETKYPATLIVELNALREPISLGKNKFATLIKK